MDQINVVDLAILALLAGGIGYGYLVSRRLERLRTALIAFGPALEAYCDAVARSEKSVRELRTESGRLETPAQVRAMPVPAQDERAALMATLTDFIRKGRR